MTLVIGYEVLVRYAFNNPTSFAYDLSYMMYGALFMMAGAYTLSRDGHVRADFLYRLWKPTTQAKVELALYLLFFFPGILALIFAGFDYARASWTYMGGEQRQPGGRPDLPAQGRDPGSRQPAFFAGHCPSLPLLDLHPVGRLAATCQGRRGIGGGPAGGP